MIHLDRISKRISSRFSLKEISLVVQPGQLTALIGPNGSGKTSIVRLISGIYQPDSGVITVNGLDRISNSSEARSVVGVATDRLFLYPWLSVMEYLEHCAALYHLKRSDWLEQAKNLLEFYGLAGYTHSSILDLSNGMKQKLNLIRAVLHSPKALLLDEPTLALDPQAVRLLAMYLKGFTAGGGSVLLCTHDLSFVTKVAEEVHFIVNGEIVDVLTLDRMRALYSFDVMIEDPDVDLRAEFSKYGLSVQIQAVQGSSYMRVEYPATRGDFSHDRILSTLHNNHAKVVDHAARREDALGTRYELLLHREK